MDTEIKNETVIEEPVESGQPNPTFEEIEIDYLDAKKKLKDFTPEEIKTSIQKGLNADRIKEKWETSKAKLNEFEGLARELGYFDKDGHGDIDAMLASTKEQMTKAQIQKIAEEGVPEEIAEELYKARKEAEELRKYKAEADAKARKESEYAEFCSLFKDVNGREFNPTSDQIPAEVWQIESTGKPLASAYAEYSLKQAKKQSEIAQKNEANKAKSAGSIGTGATPETLLTEEQLRSMSRTDAQKNYDLVMRSYKALRNKS